MILLIPINGVVAMKMRTLQVGARTGALLLPGAPGQVLGRAFTNLGPLNYFVHSPWMAISRSHKPQLTLSSQQP